MYFFKQLMKYYGFLGTHLEYEPAIKWLELYRNSQAGLFLGDQVTTTKKVGLQSYLNLEKQYREHVKSGRVSSGQLKQMYDYKSYIFSQLTVEEQQKVKAMLKMNENQSNKSVDGPHKLNVSAKIHASEGDVPSVKNVQAMFDANIF